MTDSRSVLPEGTTVALEGGNTYIITGSPIGWGGGSIIYPAERCILRDGKRIPDGFSYALKECFPLSLEHKYVRDQQGEIREAGSDSSEDAYLLQAKRLQFQESNLSQSIYKTASRMLPVREASHNIVLCCPEHSPVRVCNTVTVMDSLSEKGRSVRSLLQEQRRVALFDTFRIIEQLLFALQEVHHAGFLHLDIQDGNIFLKGSLSDNSQLLTLIDFGSARPMPDGKTAPIADRVIFTSEGFSAPEIILGNDGTLCLTPEADLYSVGCLALYLLTGHRPNMRTLMYNRSGKFLTQSQLSRLKCPRHLSDRLQAILSRALEIAPEKRYHSTEEMLADVSDLIGALRPYRTDLSSVKYDAFISYRHGMVDSTAASVLQQQLENFRIPKDLRKDRQSFRRVFVDEGELSSCADYGQQIREALKNSGWLIVICSPETPASIWVQQEIDAFLENHDRSRILAVLTSGDPDTSFPPQLKADAEGNGEVLAADARGQNANEVIRLLKKDALLKIAAPMLGTTFDALKQRRKVQQMKRAITGAGAAVALLAAFSAYAVNRANIIAEQAEEISAQADALEVEYRNALISESRLLSSEARKRLNDNDPLSALELTLAALPSAEQNRPVIPEAEAVLNKALNVYRTPTAAKHSAIVTGVLPVNAADFFLDDSGQYIVTVGSTENEVESGNCQVWNAETLKLVHTLAEKIYSPILIPGTTHLAGKMYDGIACIDYVANSVIWKDACQNTSVSTCLSPDGKTVMVLEEGESMNIRLLSAQTGEISHSLSGKLGNLSSLKCEAISDNVRWAVVSGYSDSNSKVYLLIDFEKEQISRLEEPGGLRSLHDQWRFRFVDEKLAILWGGGIVLNTVQDYAEIKMMTLDTAVMECIDLVQDTKLWSISCQYLPESLYFYIDDITDSLGTGIVFAFGNEFIMVDADTGELRHHASFSSGIRDVVYKDGEFSFVCENGSVGCFVYPLTAEFQAFGAPVEKAEYNGNIALIQSSNKIMKYSLGEYSKFFQLMYERDNDYIYLTDRALRLAPEGIQLVSFDGDELRIFHEGQESERVISVIDSLEDPDTYLQFLGITKNGEAAYFLGEYDDDYFLREQVIRTDLQSGVSEVLQQKTDLANELFPDGFAFWNDRIYCVADNFKDDTCIVYVYDGIEESIQEWIKLDKVELGKYPLLWELERSSIQLNEEKGQLYFVMSSYSEEGIYNTVCYSVDLETRAVKTAYATIPRQNWRDKITCYWDDSQETIGFVCGDTFYTFNQNGEALSRIALNMESQLESVCFVRESGGVLLLYSNGQCDLHQVSDGNKLASVALNDHMVNSLSSLSVRDPRWEKYQDHLILSVHPKGTVNYKTMGWANYDAFELQITGSDLIVLAHIPEYAGFDAERNRFVIAGTKEIGAITVPSLEELIEYGNRILSGEP